MALLGVVLVTFNGKAVLKVNPVGDLLAFGAAFMWAAYSVIVRKISAFGYPVVIAGLVLSSRQRLIRGAGARSGRTEGATLVCRSLPRKEPIESRGQAVLVNHHFGLF